MPERKAFPFGSIRKSTTPCSAGLRQNFGASTGRSNICFAARCAMQGACRDRKQRRPSMQRRSERSSFTLPSPLLESTPRQVRLNGAGIAVLIASAALVLGGLWGGSEIYRRAATSARRVALFASEGISTDAQVVRVQQRRGERQPPNAAPCTTDTSSAIENMEAPRPCAGPTAIAT